MLNLLKIDTDYGKQRIKPIKMRLSTFIDMAKGIESNLALKLCYADIIASKYLGTKKAGKNIDSWVLFRNDDQMRAIIEILQNNGLVPKTKNFIIIPH